jgi:hypothetical protein
MKAFFKLLRSIVFRLWKGIRNALVPFALRNLHVASSGNPEKWRILLQRGRQRITDRQALQRRLLMQEVSRKFRSAKVGKPADRVTFQAVAAPWGESVARYLKSEKRQGMGNWLIKILSLIPYIVSGIETIHGDTKSGADKKQLAMESLGLAAGAAEAADPGQKPSIIAATQLASSTIDGVVAVYNAVKPKVATPAPATPTPSTQSGPIPFTPAT